MRQVKKQLSILLGLLCLGMGTQLEAQTRVQSLSPTKPTSPVQRRVRPSKTLVGVIRDSKTQKALPGVRVTNLRSREQSLSDAQGKYQITVRYGDRVRFEYIGFNSQTHYIRAYDELNIYLVAKKQKSNEIEAQIPEEFKVVSVEEAEAVVTLTVGKSMPLGAIPERGDEAKPIKQNGFISARHEPLSTFSTDVDVASYAVVRRNLSEQGRMPEKEFVRTEELLNYFDYDYPKPQKGEPVDMQVEAMPCPWAKGHLVARIGLKAQEIDARELPPSHLVFLIDVSGSMYGPQRLGLVKSSLRLLVNNLRDEDKVSIVVYAGNAGLVLPPTSGGNKQKIIDALNNLEAGGSTAGGEGIQLAYKVATEHFIKGGNNRVILCSDGDFNVGVSSEAALERLIEAKRQTGVYLTILGYGMGNYKDNRLQSLSEKGNGNHAYIDNLQEANRVLVGQFGSTMYAVAKDVKLQVEFNPQHIAAYRLLGYESRLMANEDFNDDKKDAGDLGAGHRVTALYELIPVGVESSFLPKVAPLKYQNEAQAQNNKELLTVSLRYKPLNSEESKLKQVSLSKVQSQINGADNHFALAVAMFAERLRGSEYSRGIKYADIIKLAEQGFGRDKGGYRREFVRLVQIAEGLDR